MVWHPFVHHSMLLLRALQQPHTLQIDPHAATINRLSVPLLSECAMELSVCFQPGLALSDTTPDAPRGHGLVLYRPEDLLHTLRCPPRAWNGPTLSSEMQELAAGSVVEYLEASAVSAHIMSAVDALLVALNTGDMETIRRTHARVMDLVERLESSIADDESLSGSTQGSSDPLSSWPLFSVLRFLVEDGQLLMSAFPRTTKAYARLSSSSKAIALHQRLVRRTMDEQVDAGFTSSSGSGSTAESHFETSYPAKGFLRDVQRHLAAYNRGVEEQTTEGVTGEKGPLRSRVSGGRMGVQAVPARLPWTLKGTPLRKQ